MFRSMRKCASATTLAVAMAMAPAAIGCGGAGGGDGAGAAPAETARAASAPRYDAESLVRGVFFGQGEVGARLGIEQKAVDPRDAAAIDAIVAHLIEGDPADLRAFATDIQSGDVLRVRDAATAVGKRIAEITSSFNGSQQAACLVIWTIGDVVAPPPPFIYIVARTVGDTTKRDGLAADDWAVRIATHLATSDEAAPRARFDGDALLRGLFFGQGEVGDRVVPEWKASAPAGTEQAADAYVSWIRAHDAAFFDRFGVEVQSGDMSRVAAAIDEATARMKAARGELANGPEATRAPVLDYVLLEPPVLYTVIGRTSELPQGLARDQLAERVVSRLSTKP